MLFLISIAIALCIAFFGGTQLKKHPQAFYFGAAALTVTVITVSKMISYKYIDLDNRFIKDYIIGIFAKGALPGAFWCIVMWTGALPNGSAAIKKLMPIRGELSILAAVLSMAHVLTYALNYIMDKLRGRTGNDSQLLTVIFCFVGIIMLIIMIPLTVMSFKTVRKKMNAKRWKQLQRAAYIFYAFLYIHIVILYAPKARRGFEGYFFSILVYTVVFVGYAVFRIRKRYLKEHKDTNKNFLNMICGAVIAAAIGGSIFLSYDRTSAKEPAKGPTRERKAQESETVETTTAENLTTTADISVTAPFTTQTAPVTTSAETETATENITEAAAEEGTEEAEVLSVLTEQPDSSTEEPLSEAATEAPAEVPERSPLKYKNGTFTGSADGYDGKIYVSIIIENDRIVSISASSEEEEPEYFEMAERPVISRIIEAQNTYVDAVSGATYSSFGIMEAVENAMASALN